ncbi:hypothetical protein GOP47_0020685 [Adiantum capillus-veneris]|uniref:Uncharacterized protein n=1 Tax=Adiantum capillus-veneris TaxID=13818 RepID=A0A9D4Z7P2_ADICA|nr:hypothetical protein GOP47_0020685 [Adiantum capillus-veneris]
MTAMRVLIKTTLKDQKPQGNLLKKNWFAHEEVEFTRQKLNAWLNKALGWNDNVPCFGILEESVSVSASLHAGDEVVVAQLPLKDTERPEFEGEACILETNGESGYADSAQHSDAEVASSSSEQFNMVMGLDKMSC